MGFFNSFFGGGDYKNPADVAMPYLNQIPGQTNQYFEPYFNKGKEALGRTFDEYGNLIDDPGAKLNHIAEGYKESPGLQFAIQKAMQGANNAAAAGGMAGSPEHQETNMGLATNLANQDFGNWMSNALGLYGNGLSGMEGVSTKGQQAGQSMADMIAQTLAQKANLAYAGQQNENQQNASGWNNLFKGVGALSAFTPWGAAGGAMDTAFNRFFGGSKQ